MSEKTEFKRLIRLNLVPKDILDRLLKYTPKSESFYAEDDEELNDLLQKWMILEETDRSLKLSAYDGMMIFHVEILKPDPINDEVRTEDSGVILVTFQFTEEIERNTAIWFLDTFMRRISFNNLDYGNVSQSPYVPCVAIHEGGGGEHYVLLSACQLEALNGKKSQVRCEEGYLVSTTAVLLNCGRDEDIIP